MARNRATLAFYRCPALSSGSGLAAVRRFRQPLSCFRDGDLENCPTSNADGGRVPRRSPPEELLPCPDRCPLLVTMAHIYFAARLSRFYQDNCRHLAREALYQLRRRLCLPCTRGSSPQAA